MGRGDRARGRRALGREAFSLTRQVYAERILISCREARRPPGAARYYSSLVIWFIVLPLKVPRLKPAVLSAPTMARVMSAAISAYSTALTPWRLAVKARQMRFVMTC